MKNNKFLLFIVAFAMFIFIGCNNKDKQDTEQNSRDTAKVENITSNIEDDNNDYIQNPKLTIIGNQIWVRSEPTTGEVIMKLDDGTECEVLEKGKQETIHGTTDYWYKISCNGKQGWVFGSQTSLKQEQKLSDNQNVTRYMQAFGQTLKSNYKSLFDSDSIFVLDNYFAGLSASYQSINDVKEYFTKENYNLTVHFDKDPEFDGETFVEDGIFILPRNDGQYIEMWLTEDDRLFDKAQKIDKKIKYYVYVINKGEKFAFYSGQINNELKVVAVDISVPGEA